MKRASLLIYVLLLPLLACFRHDKLVSVSIQGDLAGVDRMEGRWCERHSGRSLFVIASGPASLSMRVHTEDPLFQLVAAQAEAGRIRVDTRKRDGQIGPLYLSLCPDESLAVTSEPPQDQECSKGTRLLRDESWRQRFFDLKRSIAP